MSVKKQTPESNSRRIATASENARKRQHFDTYEKLLNEIDEHLTSHWQNSVYCGSKLHQRIQAALHDAAKNDTERARLSMRAAPRWLFPNTK